jgi:mannose-6-phosphate isomerase
MTVTLSPFRLRPWFRTRIWGVRDLSPWYSYTVTGEPIGEVWLSGDDCLVDNGPLAGQRFAAVFAGHREALLGPGWTHAERFPLLMKVLFPKEKLSVQVHPGDALAREAGEPHGKTECWYVLDAAPDATVALGLRPGTTEEQMRAAIMNNGLEPLLHWIPAHKGDMIFVDAGTIHAIGPGAVLLETQQNSDMTYRLYDYGRPRELHLQDGLKAARAVTRAGKVAPRPENGGELLVQSEYFHVDRFHITGGERRAFHAAIPGLDSSSCVQLIFAARGTGSVQWEGGSLELSRGQLAVIPASNNAWTFLAAEETELLRARPL